jgi:hypothetical protein
MLKPCMGWNHYNFMENVDCGSQIDTKKLLGKNYQYIKLFTMIGQIHNFLLESSPNLLLFLRIFIQILYLTRVHKIKFNLFLIFSYIEQLQTDLMILFFYLYFFNDKRLFATTRTFIRVNACQH